MKKNRYDLWEKEEYNYPLACGFMPNIVSCLHEDETIRPCILITPGGGYRGVSPAEGEIVANVFYEKGYQVFVLTYTTNYTYTAPLMRQPMHDLGRAIRMIRKDAPNFHVDPDKIILCGFSAGGHLSASVCVHYEDIVEENKKYADISARPDAAILSYPVITSGEYAHQDSFKALCGENEKETAYMSLEKYVTSDTPPCFIWHTATDDIVPVENSYLFAQSCKKAGVTFAHHVFSQGGHGLSLANEDWAEENYGEPYTYEQEAIVISLIAKGELSFEAEIEENLKKEINENHKNKEMSLNTKKPNEEVRVWPLLAQQWLKEQILKG